MENQDSYFDTPFFIFMTLLMYEKTHLLRSYFSEITKILQLPYLKKREKEKWNFLKVIKYYGNVFCILCPKIILFKKLCLTNTTVIFLFHSWKIIYVQIPFFHQYSSNALLTLWKYLSFQIFYFTNTTATHFSFCEINLFRSKIFASAIR